jgi:hypothetical protein
LYKYQGAYNVVSAIPKENIDISHVRIIINNDDIPIFILRARFGVYNKKSDGFVFDTGKNIILSGLSEYLNTFIVISKVVNPNSDLMHGMIAIENRVSGDCYSAEIYLTHETNDKMRKIAETKLGEHFVKV